MAEHETVTKADVDSKVTTHEEKTTGVHGVGASPVCSETEADNKVCTRRLTVALFQANAATGTFSTEPYAINDNSIEVPGGADAIDEYAEVDFGAAYTISQWRQYGSTMTNGSGEWKIQYWDGTAWQDWETGIATRATANWSEWASPAVGAIITTKIRLVCTVVDTKWNYSYIAELEIKF